jgi:hypothetical protein
MEQSPGVLAAAWGGHSVSGARPVRFRVLATPAASASSVVRTVMVLQAVRNHEQAKQEALLKACVDEFVASSEAVWQQSGSDAQKLPGRDIFFQLLKLSQVAIRTHCGRQATFRDEAKIVQFV